MKEREARSFTAQICTPEIGGCNNTIPAGEWYWQKFDEKRHSLYVGNLCAKCHQALKVPSGLIFKIERPTPGAADNGFCRCKYPTAARALANPNCPVCGKPPSPLT